MKRFYLGLIMVTVAMSGCATSAGFRVGPEQRCISSSFHSNIERGNSTFVSASQVGKNKYRLDISSKADLKKDD
jgi:outer membrane lipoprotein-sorting protein